MITFPTNPEARVTQKFGENAKDYSCFGLRGHNGIDYGVNVGTPVYAIGDGVVTTVAELTSGYGRHIRIAHDGFTAIYAHLSKTVAVVGETLEGGTRIGLSGGARADKYCGNSTGAHLHFEIRPDGTPANNGYGGAVDPTIFMLKFSPDAPLAGIVIGDWLRVRTKPVYGNILYHLRKGDIVEVELLVDGWAKLRSLRPEWASATYLTVGENTVSTSVRYRACPYPICPQDGK